MKQLSHLGEQRGQMVIPHILYCLRQQKRRFLLMMPGALTVGSCTCMGGL